MSASSASVPARASGSFFRRFATWWTILRISIEERLVYRGDFMLGTLMRFLPMITYVFLWGAIFAAVSPGTSQSPSAHSSTTIAGFRYSDMIAYYLLAMIG